MNPIKDDPWFDWFMLGALLIAAWILVSGFFV